MRSLSETEEMALAASTKFALRTTSPIIAKEALKARKMLLEQSKATPVQKTEAAGK